MEIDGGVHQQSVEADRERDELLRARALTVLRFSNDVVFTNLETVVEKILNAVRSSPPSPL